MLLRQRDPKDGSRHSEIAMPLHIPWARTLYDRGR